MAKDKYYDELVEVQIPRKIAIKLKHILAQNPDANIEDVVRCKDCKCHCYETVPSRGEIQHFCSRHNKQVFSDFYCADGERKEEKNENYGRGY